MNRRNFLPALITLLALPSFTWAQVAAKIPRIGFMRGEKPPQAYLDAFESRLRRLGYSVGQDVFIEYRFSDTGTAGLARVAEELVGSKVDIIVAAGAQATRAARRATGVIPIVMSPATDPVGNGFVANLAQPGGNITGMGLFNWELIGKRVQLLREIMPTVARVAVLFNQSNPAPVGVWEASLAAAASIGIGLRQFAVRTSADFEPTFAKIASERFGALVVVQSPLFDTPPFRIVQFAAVNRLPTIYGLRLLTEAGGLVSYGPNVAELYGQAATFVAKILRGAKPADLPVEQPTKIELVLNLKTARELGLAIPQSVLLRADDAIT